MDLRGLSHLSLCVSQANEMHVSVSMPEPDIRTRCPLLKDCHSACACVPCLPPLLSACVPSLFCVCNCTPSYYSFCDSPCIAGKAAEKDLENTYLFTNTASLAQKAGLPHTHVHTQVQILLPPHIYMGYRSPSYQGAGCRHMTSRTAPCWSPTLASPPTALTHISWKSEEQSLTNNPLPRACGGSWRDFTPAWHSAPPARPAAPIPHAR